MNMRNVREDTLRRTHKRKGAYKLTITLEAPSITKPLAERIYRNIHKVLQAVGAIGCIQHTCTISKREEK